MASKRGDLAEYIACQPASSRKKLAKEVAAYLLTTKQVGQLESLLRDVMAVREANGEVEAQVTSAHELDAAMIADIKKIIQKQKPGVKQVAVETTNDPTALGGLNIRLAHQQLDLTVRAKIDTFKRLITKGA